MGIPEGPQTVPDAAGGSPAHSLAVRSALTGFLRDRGGVTAIEYGLLCALTTLAVLGAIYTLGNQTLTQLFEVVASSM